MNGAPIDPIDLEVLRTRLESVGEQACRTVENTAISPAITESRDYSVTLMDADGGLIIGSGQVVFHYGAAAHAVRSTIARYGAEILPGDVFLSNDPHNGGGLHPQDVMVQQPIYSGGIRVGWVAVSAHLMDMGGMVIGSFAPEATECYQEAFRIPPVRLFREGRENSDVWDLLRTNVRMAALVEMDLRGLVAGCFFTSEKIGEIVEQTGADLFTRSLTTIRDLSERELRRRISLLEDGVYKCTSWTEYNRNFFEIPCALTVAGDELIFDFAGAAPQCGHFFNTKPYIVASELMVMLQHRMAPDLPFNNGLFAPVAVVCPPGSIVNADPPAAISAAHMHVGMNAAGVAMQALTMAMAASPESPQHRYLGGAGWESALATQVWSWTGADGQPDAFIALDGNWVGGSAGAERDGGDLGRNPTGIAVRGAFPDIEVLESWFPLLFTERRTRHAIDGAGTFRAGGGNVFGFRPHGVAEIEGTLFGMRRWLPLQGMAGGMPGACTELSIERADGKNEVLAIHGSGHVAREGDTVRMRLASGGGFGDSLDRDPAAVSADLADGRITSQQVGAVYGVVFDAAGNIDLDATGQRRSALRRARLGAATPAERPLRPAVAEAIASVDEQPLYPGIVQRGAVAFAKASGAPLAVAPDHWTDGCPVVVERRWAGDEPDVVLRHYLDPQTGAALHVEVALDGAPRSFAMAPDRWTQAGRAARVA